MKRLFILLGCLFTLSVHAQRVTLETCIEQARNNYPLILKYGLIERTEDLSLSDIDKDWLPRITLSGQATVQSAVPEFPDRMKPLLQGAGIGLPGLRKDQYKVAAEVNQTVWDGGKAKAGRAIARAQAAAQTAENAVNTYAVDSRVHELYFAILQTEAQAEQHELTIQLLQANIDKIRSMITHGTAMQWDADALEAERLTLVQNNVSIRSQAQSYRRMLAVFTGHGPDGVQLICPSDEVPADLDNARPELVWFDARTREIESRRKLTTTLTRPRIGLFAQAYYGYPGYDYFGSMTSRNWTVNALAGVKLTWSIDAFYTQKNRQSKLSLIQDDIALAREVFLFNSRVETTQRLADIEEQKAVIAEDERIISLRTNVRRAAESRLNNGVADTTELLDKITAEAQARLRAANHKIALAKAVSMLRHTLNQ